jgi:hypothetical protein
VTTTGSRPTSKQPTRATETSTRATDSMSLTSSRPEPRHRCGQCSGSQQPPRTDDAPSCIPCGTATSAAWAPYASSGSARRLAPPSTWQLPRPRLIPGPVCGFPHRPAHKRCQHERGRPLGHGSCENDSSLQSMESRLLVVFFSQLADRSWALLRGRGSASATARGGRCRGTWGGRVVGSCRASSGELPEWRERAGASSIDDAGPFGLVRRRWIAFCSDLLVRVPLRSPSWPPLAFRSPRRARRPLRSLRVPGLHADLARDPSIA